MSEQIVSTDGLDDEDFALDKYIVPAVRRAVADGNGTALAALLMPLHSADIADLLEQVDSGDRRDMLLLGADLFDGEVLSDLDEGLREEVIEILHPQVLADAVRDLESDDVVDLLEDLEIPQQEAILDALEDADRVAVERALSYPEDSAGRLMQREVVIAPEHWNVGEAIDYLRARDDLPEQFYHVILTDPRLKPTGYVTLGKLLGAPRKVALGDLTEDNFRTFRVTQPEESVAYAFNQYHLISAPVVDEDSRLAGVITIDDAMGVLDEEFEEDIMRLAGVGEG
ncbi:MAG: magnesium transporter, partial [Halocynthiibacter sp.]